METSTGGGDTYGFYFIMIHGNLGQFHPIKACRVVKIAVQRSVQSSKYLAVQSSGNYMCELECDRNISDSCAKLFFWLFCTFWTSVNYQGQLGAGTPVAVTNHTTVTN